MKINDYYERYYPCIPKTNLSLNLLTKHCSIFGGSGCGKTQVLYSIKTQLHMHNIPFINFELAKTEHRKLKTFHSHDDPHVKSLAEKLQIYTPGKSELSFMSLAPFEFQKDEVTLDEHIDLLIRCFKASFDTFGPMQALLKESIYAIYKEAKDGQFPNMADLYNKIRSIVEKKNYQGEVHSNIVAAIEVRIGDLICGSLGSLFQQNRSFPNIKSLIETPTLIELDHMESENASLTTLFILTRIKEHIKTWPPGSALKYVIILEESHVLLAPSDSKGNEVKDPKKYVAEEIARMLAELRAFGVGIIIVDQLPTQVAPEVIKNTGTKIVFRTISEDDRKTISWAMNLTSEQTQELARLKPGEAFFYNESLHSARRIKCLNIYEYLNMKPEDHPTGEKILDFIGPDAWFQEALYLQLRDLAEKVISIDKKHQEAVKQFASCENNLNEYERQKNGKSIKNPTLKDISYRLQTVNEERISFFEDIYDEAYETLGKKVQKVGNQKAVQLFNSIQEKMDSESIPDGYALSRCFKKLMGRVNNLEQKEYGDE